MGERLFISGECIGETLEIFYFRHNTTGGPTFWGPFVFCTHLVLKLEMILVVVDMEADKLAHVVVVIVVDMEVDMEVCKVASKVANMVMDIKERLTDQGRHFKTGSH